MENGSNSDYIIPFGLDTTDVFKGFDDIINKSEQLGSEVTQTVGDMQKAFVAASAGSDKLAKSLETDRINLKSLREEARQAGAAIKDAISGKVADGTLETKIAAIKKRLEQLNADNKKLGFNFDEAGFQEFQNRLAAAGGDIKQLALVAEFAKGKLAELTPGSEEFKALSQQVQIAEGFIEGLGGTIDEVVNSNVTLRSELNQTRDDMAKLALAGLENSDEFRNLSNRAGELQEKIGDVSKRVKILASDSRYLDAGVQAVQGLVGAFTAAQGALALFGDENEEAQKVIQKVTGAMAVLQGIQAVSQALNKDSALVILVLNALRTKQTAIIAAETVAETANTAATAANAEVTATATVATTAWNTALLLNPIVLLTVAIVAGVAAIIQYASATNEAADAAERLNNQLDFEKTLLDDSLADLDRATRLRLAYAKSRGEAESSITQLEREELQKQINARQAYSKVIEQNAENIEASYKKGKLDEEEYSEAIQASIKERTENNNALLDLQNQKDVKAIDIKTQRNKENEEAEKKRTEAEKKAREDRIKNAEKEAEEKRKINEQLLRFTRELANQQLEAMDEGTEREKAEARQRAKVQIENLEAEQALTQKAANIRKDLILQINENLAKELKEIDQNTAKERAALQLQASQQIAEYELQNVSGQIRILQLSAVARAEEIKETFKNETDLRDQLLKALYAKVARDEAQLLRENASLRLNQEEEAELLTIELMSKYAVDSANVEEQKQIELLKIQLKYAQLRAAAIVQDGTQETNLLKLQAEKAVADLTKALDKAVTSQKTKGLDFFKLLGLGDLSDSQKAAVINAAEKSLEAIQEITGFIIGNYQRQIDKKQELIDLYDEDLGKLEDQLDEEKKLRENGFANNVSLLEAEIAEKKRAREEEIKQQEELQRKQAQIQKAQIVVDSAAQVSNLITASTSIFKSFATIPFGLGIPLAIATVALMSGAFVASKVAAFKAVNDAQKLEKGGLITGKRHSQGGKRFVSQDGDNVELEGGEYAVNRTATSKHKPLLDAINYDTWTDQYLKSYLEGLGINMGTDVKPEAIRESRQLDESRLHIMTVGAGGGDLSDISENVAFLAGKKRWEIERWEDDEYRYSRQGSVTTRIKKKNIN